MQLLKNIFSKTFTTSLLVASSNGFHLRPAAKFSAEAKKLSCEVTATFKHKTVNAKAVNALLSLNLEYNDTLTLQTKGKGAQVALETLTRAFQSLMKNDKKYEAIQTQDHQYEGASITGESIYTGIAIAPIFAYSQKETYTPNDISFNTAIDLAIQELDTEGDTENTAISLAQKELLLALSANIVTFERFKEKIEEESRTLKGGKYESKISDYLDLLKRVKKHLGYAYDITFPEHSFILLSDDLLPSDIPILTQSKVQGVILKHTSVASHSAILLRAEGIPSLITADIKEYSDTIILDTQCAVVVTHPSKKDLKQAKDTLQNHANKMKKSYADRFISAQTRQGKPINVYANISDIASATLAKEEGAEGIGLLRTEFLFDTVKPSLEIQTKAYKEIFHLFSHITVRTLDVGGDKSLPYIQLPKEQNPFLGIRGIRLLKTHSALMEEQLHAIFLAAQNRPIKIMFPMVCEVEEFNEAKTFALHIAQKNEIDISNILFGIMIEVPSVLFLLKEFNAVVDFYSIGTNDLTQYLFAIERTHPTLKTNALSPVIFSVLESIVLQVDKPLSICGELASDTKAIPKLIHLGIKTLSVSAKSIAQTKQEIRHV